MDERGYVWSAYARVRFGITSICPFIPPVQEWPNSGTPELEILLAAAWPATYSPD
jgi:hypothetical protein